MRKKVVEARGRERRAPTGASATGSSAEGAERKAARSASEAEAVARAVLEALSAHDPL